MTDTTKPMQGLARAAEIVQAEIERAEALLNVEKDGRPIYDRYQTEAGICALRTVLEAIQMEAAADTTKEPVARDGWFLDAKWINHLQDATIEELSQRGKGAHTIDVVMRANGQNFYFQADWIKHLERAHPPAQASEEPTHEQTMAGYDVACQFGVYEATAFKLSDAMFKAHRDARHSADNASPRSDQKETPYGPAQRLDVVMGEELARDARLAALEEAAKECDVIVQKHWDDYKGRFIGPHPRPHTRGNPYTEGNSDGADELRRCYPSTEGAEVMAVTDRMHRLNAMQHAYLIFHAKNVPERMRMILCWRHLLEWASLGGKPEEVIR